MQNQCIVLIWNVEKKIIIESFANSPLINSTNQKDISFNPLSFIKPTSHHSIQPYSTVNFLLPTNSTPFHGQGPGQFWSFLIVHNFLCISYNFFCTPHNFRANFYGTHIWRENRVITCNLNRINFWGQIIAINRSGTVHWLHSRLF